MIIWFINLYVEINEIKWNKQTNGFVIDNLHKLNFNKFHQNSNFKFNSNKCLSLKSYKSPYLDWECHWMGYIPCTREMSLDSCDPVVYNMAPHRSDTVSVCEAFRSASSVFPIDRRECKRPTLLDVPSSPPTDRKIVECPRDYIYYWCWHRWLHQRDGGRRCSGLLCVVWCIRQCLAWFRWTQSIALEERRPPFL